MSKRKRTEETEIKQKDQTDDFPPRCWNLPPPKKPSLPSFGPPGGALELIHFDSKKWHSGERLKFVFLKKPFWVVKEMWIDNDTNKNLIREAFKDWNEIVGVIFEETKKVSEAKIRIGFLKDGRTWSFVGTDILNQPDQYNRTMNYGWELATDWRGKGVAIHEIGHTLDFPHEHQNPKAGFEWNVEETIKWYQARTNPPWTREMVEHNVTNPLDPNEVTSTDFDPISIMTYGVAPGLIKAPAKYNREGLQPTAALSDVDRAAAALWYPKVSEAKELELEEGKLALLNSEAPGQTFLSFTPTSDGPYTLNIVGPVIDAQILLSQGDETLKARNTRGGLKPPNFSWNMKAKETYRVGVRINAGKSKKALYLVAAKEE